MAVKRVFGRIDGTEVVLTYGAGDTWSVPVPFDVDGEYVVEIIAEDEAGNQSYLAKMLFVVNTALLCAHIVPLLYFGELLDGEYRAEQLCDNITTELEEGIYCAKISSSDYYAEIIEPSCDLEERGS